MLQLHEDFNFHYEAMRAIGTVPFGGADITEVFQIMPRIKAGDFESWYEEWFGLAQRVLSSIDESKEDSYSPVTLRSVYFRASHYFYVADFFLHGNKQDPRATECFDLYKRYFNKANALLDMPGEHYNVALEGGYQMPLIVYRAAKASSDKPRPTLLVGGGFESTMEETYHVHAVPALERNYNVILYEGPGHRTVLNQGRGFIAEWEKAVNPIMDFIISKKSDEFAFIDTEKIGLIGVSMGGLLAARAAAFEPRLAALLCIDGVWSMLTACHHLFPEGKEAFEKGDGAEFDRLFKENPESWSTGRRWFHDDLLYTFNTESGYEAFKVLEKLTLANGIAEKIKMPAFIADAEDDMFFKGQPTQVAEAIGSNATLKVFLEKYGAQLHCHSGALNYLNQELCEWFAGIVGH